MITYDMDALERVIRAYLIGEIERNDRAFTRFEFIQNTDDILGR